MEKVYSLLKYLHDLFIVIKTVEPKDITEESSIEQEIKSESKEESK